MKISLSSPPPPQLIDAIPANGSAIKKQVRRILKKINEGAVKKVEKYGNGFLWKYGDNSNGCYFFVVGDPKIITTNELGYFVLYRKVNIPGNILGNRPATRQVLVSRLLDPPFTPAGIAQYVFFKRLLPVFKTCVSDTQQSQKGAQFWQHVVLAAFKENRKVTVFNIKNFSTNTPKDYDEFAENVKDVWGTAHTFKDVLIAIEE